MKVYILFNEKEIEKGLPLVFSNFLEAFHYYGQVFEEELVKHGYFTDYRLIPDGMQIITVNNENELVATYFIMEREVL